ncbi:hypothetical protein BC828DRAFT_393309 [Blastocladiella britannica]|nr:hypothetical protein BC828DRAFT_393309 [Blastocladiella britannica]
MLLLLLLVEVIMLLLSLLLHEHLLLVLLLLHELVLLLLLLLLLLHRVRVTSSPRMWGRYNASVQHHRHHGRGRRRLLHRNDRCPGTVLVSIFVVF